MQRSLLRTARQGQLFKANVFTQRTSSMVRLASSSSWSQTISFASPESDFGLTLPHENYNMTSSSARAFSGEAVWSKTLSFASPESDFCNSVAELDGYMLPETLADALLLDESNVACVVTTVDAPHRIVHVNNAWEELCGYSKADALHHTLSLIQGQDTNEKLLRSMVDDLLKTHIPQEAYVVNYNSSGTPFTNHLRAGYMKESNGVEYLVGFLSPVQTSPPLSLRTARILA